MEVIYFCFLTSNLCRFFISRLLGFFYSIIYERIGSLKQMKLDISF